jgi:glycosyltransferase involved in cell wall biosynthesis
MRIAHVTATFPPYRGGTGNVCFHNARELALRGHEVHVFTAALPGAAPLEDCDGVTVHRLRPLMRVGNAPVLPGLLWALRGFDVIHLHAPFILGAELTALCALGWRTPLVMTYHNDLVRSGTWRDAAFRFATWSSRATAFQHARRVLFVSQGHAETCDQRSVYRRRSEQCRIMPNGVDTLAFRPAADKEATRHQLRLPPGAPVVGFVGGLDRAHHYKGLEVLLEAMASPPLSHALLLVVGAGDLEAHYHEQARQLGLAARTLFYGAVSHDRLPALYRACDVVAMPSLVPESFGLVVVEAQACGVPVVASAGPGTCSLVQQGVDGLLVAPGSVAELAAGLAHILGLPAEQRRAMGETGRGRIEASYAWERVGARLSALYQQVLGEVVSDRPAEGEQRWSIEERS